MHRVTLVVCFCLLAFAIAPQARAEQTRVLLLEFPTMKGAWPQANQQTHAELLSLGLSVVVAPEPASWFDIVPLTRNRGAVAALRIARLATPLHSAPPPSRVGMESDTQLATLLELTVYDAQTGTYRVEQVDRRGGEPLTVEATAILAAEFLNASLVQLAPEKRNDFGKQPSAALPESSTNLPDLAPPLHTRTLPSDDLPQPMPAGELKRFGLRIEAVPRFDIEVGGAWAVRLAALGRLTKILSLGIEVELPVIPWSFESDANSSSLESRALSLELGTTVDVTEEVEWESRVALGAVQILSSGDAAPGAAARTERLLLPRVVVGTGLAFRLSEGVRVHAGLHVGILPSNVVIRFVEEEQASFGPVTFGATAGVSLFAF